MWWTVGSILASFGVMLGAFGAHGLEDRVTPDLIEVWNTGARYHLIHAVAVCLVAAHPARPRWAGACFVAGIVLFSGSLYLMTLTGQRWLGAITPLGGLSFIIGWFVLASARPPA